MTVRRTAVLVIGQARTILIALLAATPCLTTTGGGIADDSGAADDKEAIAEIERIGGTLVRKADDDGGESVEVFLNGASFQDRHLQLLRRVRSLRSLDLHKTRITDAGLKELG